MTRWHPSEAGKRPALSRHHDAIKGKGRWEIGIQTFGMTLDGFEGTKSHPFFELGVFSGWKTPNPNCKMRDSQPWDGMGWNGVPKKDKAM